MSEQRPTHLYGDPWLRAANELVYREVMTQAQLDAGIAQRDLEIKADPGSARTLIKVLVDLGCCQRRDMIAQLASFAKVAYIDLDATMVNPLVCEAFEYGYLDTNEIMPISLVDGMMSIACERFADTELAQEIERITGCEVIFVACDAQTIRRVRQEVLGAMDEVEEEPEAQPIIRDLICESEIDTVRVIEEAITEEADLSAASDSPVVNLVNRVLGSACEHNASDIHIEPWTNGFLVRFRIDGKLRTIAEPPKKLLPAVISRIKVLAKLDISERRVPQDGAFTVNIGETVIDFRVSTMTTKYGEKAVMRLVQQGATIPTLEELGVASAPSEQLRELSKLPNGLVLVTGPTGSGKTTTLYALLSEACAEELNVSTIEDPVERRITGASQFQINDKAGFGFVRALRSMLRQDPDVIMVGEIRDGETAALAVQASLTGHLVLSTLHTNDALSSLQRLENMGVEPYLIAASLRGVLAQRLIGRLCQQCKSPADAQGDNLQIKPSSHQELFANHTVWQAPGCPACADRGIKGRIGVYELLELDEQAAMQIFASQEHTIEPTVSMFDDGLIKSDAGLINLHDLLAVVPNPTTRDGGQEHKRRAS